MGRSHPWLEELDQPQEASIISRTCPCCDGPVSSSSRGEGSSYDSGGSSTSSCRRRMSKAASADGTESRRKEGEQPKSKELQEQEQTRALVALQAITMMFICYYAQTERTLPTSVSGFNNSTITGGVHISNTTNSDSDGTKSEPSITKGQITDPEIFSTSSENTFWKKGGRPTSPFHERFVENLSFGSWVEIKNCPRGSLPHLRRKLPCLLSTRTAGMVPV